MATNNTHQTAIVHPQAKIGHNVNILPYAVVHENVTIADNCTIGSHSVLHPNTILEDGCVIDSCVSVGGMPQVIGFDTSIKTGVIIGKNTTLRENVTIHRARKEGNNTLIGADCYIMANSHIGHDSIVEHNVTLASASLAGHVVIGHHSFITVSQLHQFTRIGAFALVPGLPVRKDILPFCLAHIAANNKIYHWRLNNVALNRGGVSKETQVILKKIIFTNLRNRQPVDWGSYKHIPEVSYLAEWLQQDSRVGYYGFLSTSHAKK